MLQHRADRSRSQHTLHYSQSPGIVEDLMTEEREGVLQSREEQQVQKINHTHHLQRFAVYKEQIKSNSINNIYTYMFVFIRKVAKFRQHKTCKILDLHAVWTKLHSIKSYMPRPPVSDIFLTASNLNNETGLIRCTADMKP